MVIDTHIHPALFAPICQDSEQFQRRCDQMNYHKMEPNDMALLKKQYGLAELVRAVLLPEDCQAETGRPAISTDDINPLVAQDPGVYIGIASDGPL